MKVYRTSLDDLADFLVEGHVRPGRDPSADLIYYLAKAWFATQRLENLGVNLSIRHTSLILPHLTKAHQDALFVRSQKMPKEYDYNLFWLSKGGRLIYDKNRE